MELSVKGKQIDVGDSLRKHVEDQLNDTVGKFFGGSINAQVTFSRDAHLFRADITVHAGRGIVLQSTFDASEPYPAFDLALERLTARLRRYKTKIKDHRADAVAEEAFMANSFVLNNDESQDEVPDNPVIVAEMTTKIETLSVSEAVMRLDLGDLPALLFKNRKNGAINMIYRRADGHIGWVDTSQGA
jgi:ribosomal subunit interface protein